MFAVSMVSDRCFVFCTPLWQVLVSTALPLFPLSIEWKDDHEI